MKFSELLKEYVDLRIEGAPVPSAWQSIESTSNARNRYHNRLAELEEEMDAAIATSKATS